MNVMGTEVKVKENDIPQDYGNIEKKFSLPSILGELDETVSSSDERQNKSTQEIDNKLYIIEKINQEIENTQAGSIKNVILNLYKLHIESRRRNEELIKWVLRAYWASYEAALAEEKTKVESVRADYTQKVAN